MRRHGSAAGIGRSFPEQTGQALGREHLAVLFGPLLPSLLANTYCSHRLCAKQFSRPTEVSETACSGQIQANLFLGTDWDILPFGCSHQIRKNLARRVRQFLLHISSGRKTPLSIHPHAVLLFHRYFSILVRKKIRAVLVRSLSVAVQGLRSRIRKKSRFQW